MKFLITRVSVLVAQLLFTYYFTEVYSSEDLGLLMFFQSSIALLLWLQLGLPQLITKSMLINSNRSTSWGYGEVVVVSSLAIIFVVGSLAFYYELSLFESIIVVLNVLIISFINLANSYSRISGDFKLWLLTSSLHHIVLLISILIFKPGIGAIMILLATFNLFTLFYVYRKSELRLTWAYDFRAMRLSFLQLGLNFGPSILVLYLRWRGMIDYGSHISDFQRELLLYSIVGIPINLLSGLVQPVMLDRSVRNGNKDTDFLSYLFIVFFVVMLLFDIIPAILFEIDVDYNNILPISFSKVLVFVLPSLMLNTTVTLIRQSKEYYYLLMFAVPLILSYLLALDTWCTIVWVTRVFILCSLTLYLLSLRHSKNLKIGLYIFLLLLTVSFDMMPTFIRYSLLCIALISSDLRLSVSQTIRGLILGDYLSVNR